MGSAGHPLMHIASHFVFRPGNEASSFLLLGDGDKLTLNRIREDKFDFSRVDLVTLSACEATMSTASSRSLRPTVISRWLFFGITCS